MLLILVNSQVVSYICILQLNTMLRLKAVIVIMKLAKKTKNNNTEFTWKTKYKGDDFRLPPQEAYPKH